MDAVVFQFHLLVQVGVNLLTNCSSAVWQHTARRNMLTEKPWKLLHFVYTNIQSPQQIQWNNHPLDLILQATLFAELRRRLLSAKGVACKTSPCTLFRAVTLE